MTSTDAAVPTMGGTCHNMLLRLAGQVPDEMLTLSRHWLAARAPEKLAQAVVAYSASQRLTLPTQDVGLLRWILETAGLDPVALDQINTTDSPIDTPADYVFAPASPEVMTRRGWEFGPCLDLTPSPEADLVEELDRVGIAAATEIPGAVALWRAWRSRADGSPWPTPRRVFLLAVDDPGEPWQAAAVLQDRLATAGEQNPQVEAFTPDHPLPAYQRAARATSALLWTSTRHEPMRLAPVYDLTPDGAPTLAPDRPHLTDPDGTAVADLLAAGKLVLSTTARLDDLLRPEGRGRVPINFRTDGVWVWSDAIGYYVREHGIAPAPEFLDHLRSGGTQNPDAVALFRATAALTRPDPVEEPAATPPHHERVPATIPTIIGGNADPE